MENVIYNCHTKGFKLKFAVVGNRKEVMNLFAKPWSSVNIMNNQGILQLNFTSARLCLMFYEMTKYNNVGSNNVLLISA